MQHKSEPLNSKKPNGTVRIAEKALKKQAYLKAIEHFTKALKIEPGNSYLLCQLGMAYMGMRRYDSASEAFEKALNFDPMLKQIANKADFFFQKGKASLEMKQYARAIMAFEQAEILDPRLAPKTGFAKKNTLILSRQISPEILTILKASFDEYLRTDLCLHSYQVELNELCQKHRNIKTFNYMEQINWIILLMEFSFKYYDRKQTPMVFVNPEYFDSSAAGNKKRFNKLESRINYIITDLTPPYAKSVDKQALAIFEHALDDIVLGDSMLILRMIFETIHQLSRKQRANLLEYLPWGTNSWYFLEFCSTFFDSNEDSQPIYFEKSLKNPKMEINAANTQLDRFYDALKDSSCLVKAVIPTLLTEDIPQLHSFFVSVRSNALIPGTPIARLGEMTNLKTLLWYFKHTYQLVRLTALAPKEPKPAIEFVNLDGRKNIELTPLLNLYMLDSHMDSLKSKLAFIRRIQLIGEIFTPRNWGSQLKDLKVIDSEMLSDIRNALCHPEDLESVAFIHNLESDTERLSALYEDFIKLRVNIYDLIAERQNSFTPWPDTSVPFKGWNEPVCVYWDSVKKHYQQEHAFNPDTYIPNKLLVTDSQLLTLQNGLNPDLPESKKLLSMIKGEAIFEVVDRNKLKEYLNPGQKEKVIFKIMQTAFKQYKSLRSIAVKEIAAENNLKKEKNKNDIIQFTSSNFPNMRKLGREANLSLHRDIEKQMGLSELLNLLKSRMTLLNYLFVDAKIDLSGNPIQCIKSIQTVICEDIEMQLACSYLTAQIVSILSKLEKLKLLNTLDPHLLTCMSQFKSLRNALEHNDPVIDSKDAGFIHMKSKVNLVMGQVSYELLVAFFKSIQEAKASLMMEQEPFDDDTDTIALNVSGLIYPSSPCLNVADLNKFMFFSQGNSSNEAAVVSAEETNSEDCSETNSKEGTEFSPQ
ncbi:tetratricopeptide repeat protein [uncultured Legionella sp.]|uniref:tetratricopeptide repeat protein n=1 Tax=uncultured Legionella sp. TaxID=210934 RepID=UPI002631BC8F|nr:tetratricopeptide repeat protein [uncultured Legionella sp.]